MAEAKSRSQSSDLLFILHVVFPALALLLMNMAAVKANILLVWESSLFLNLSEPTSAFYAAAIRTFPAHFPSTHACNKPISNPKLPPDTPECAPEWQELFSIEC
jgi:hypothetical protein